MRISIACFFCSFLLFSSQALQAQSDSTIFKKVAEKPQVNDTWHYGHTPEQSNAIDSSITKLQYYNWLQRESIEWVNTGNSGSAAYPLVFQHNKATGFNVGFNQFDIYRFVKDSIKYYRVIRPYAELNMMIGLKNEQLFKAKFANQHKNIVWYGVDFRRIFSKGTYSNQRTNNNGFSSYGIFKSRNGKWSLQTDLLFNAFKNQENGGVTENLFSRDTTFSYFNKTLAPVRHTRAENTYTQVDYYLKAGYHFGKGSTPTDSNSRPVKPFCIAYQFNIEKNKFKFRDYSVDSLDYPTFYVLRDSVYNDFSYLKIANTISFEYKALKAYNDSAVQYKNFVAGTYVNYAHYMLSNNSLKNELGNLSVTAYLRSNPLSKSRIAYKFSAEYYAYGYNATDLLADGNISYNFGIAGVISLDGAYQLKHAPYFFERYRSHSANWSFNLPSTQITSARVLYALPKYGISADFSFYHLNKLPVYPGNANPYLLKDKETMLVAHIANRNGFSGFHIDNDIWYSYGSAGGYLLSTMPVLVTKHSVFYERRLFKKALWLATGFDVRYTLGNTPSYYEPFTGQFYPAYSSVARYYPTLDFFLNFKIRTVRVMLKVDNISSSFGTKGYYVMHNYPAADISFKAMVAWRFYE